MPKYTKAERENVKTLVANLTIKRLPDSIIIQHIGNMTGKPMNRKSLWYVRQQIKKESYEWYKELREGQFEYLHQFKERINEIIDLQGQHHQIILENQNNPHIMQTSLIELHKLSITLSNLYDVAPYIISNLGLNGNNTNGTNNNSIPIKSENKEIIV